MTITQQEQMSMRNERKMRKGEKEKDINFPRTD